MSGNSLQSIKYEKGDLQLLDQLLLPLETKYNKIRNVEDGWKAINTMQVRGAPAIAVAGCLSLAVELYNNSLETKELLHEYVKKKLEYLVTSRPTAVNLAKEAARICEYSSELACANNTSPIQMKTSLIKRIEQLLDDDVSDNKQIGKHGAAKILLTSDTPVNVLTHCNTGSLATAGYGTALGVIRHLHEGGHIERVYCTETRPYLQGARLTAYELVFEGIPSTLICDSMVAALFKTKKISAVVVGADRVAANGDTANKIGTYQIAILARHHNIPFYVCAPLSSVDFNIQTGEEIVIEERPAKEMTTIMDQPIAAPGIACWNPAFDVTPASLITAIITENGAFDTAVIKDLKNIRK